MKKLLVASLGMVVIFLLSQTELHTTTVPAYKLSVYYSPKCNGYVARCGLPGNECDYIVNPICFPYPGADY